MRLHDFLDYWARQQPTAEFAIKGARRMRYAEALTTANKMAHAFIEKGFHPGDRVAVLAKNSIEYLLVYFAAAKAGVVLVPLNYRLAPPEWTQILNDARPRMLIADGQYIPSVDELRAELEAVERFLTLDEARSPGWESHQAWIVDQPSTPPERVIDADAELYQMYTSGTTGLPKGAVLSHRAVTANIVQSALAFQGRPGERSLVVAPLYHAGVVPHSFVPLSQGGALYIEEDFRPAEVVRVLSEERVGFATLVPSMIQACLVGVPEVAERQYDMLRLIHYGASPIAEGTLRRAMGVFGCDFVQSYGMTEAVQAVSYLSPADHQRAMADEPDLLLSAGQPAAGTDVQIVDANGVPQPNGAPGEIVVRGPQVMRGYWNRPDATAETLRNGWLHTGDIGTMDDEGYIYVQDRLKDMIISGGENIYPRVVENVLFQHPAVADAAVIGVPDEQWGETVKAVIVLRSGMAATEEEIIDFCRGKLAGFARPRSVDVTDTLPRNLTGKVLKRILRERYWTGQRRRVSGA